MALKLAKIRKVKRRIFSAKSNRLKYIDAVLNLVAGGMSVKAACRSQPHFPTAAQFNCRLRTDPDLRARFNAVCPRAGQSIPNLGALEHADEILRLIESGMSVRQACARSPRYPTRHAFVAALKYNSEFELRYDLALARRERPHAKALATFDEVERHLIGGSGILTILNSDRSRFPDYNSFSRFLQAYPEFDARYRAAGRARQAGLNALNHGPAFSVFETRRASAAKLLSNNRNSNELWLRAVSALPANLDRYTRDDLASSLVVSILDGSIDVEMIKKEAKRLVTTHNNQKYFSGIDSLDKSLGVDSTFTLADVLTNNWD